MEELKGKEKFTLRIKVMVVRLLFISLLNVTRELLTHLLASSMDGVEGTSSACGT